jgi:hypothetical protein
MKYIELPRLYRAPLPITEGVFLESKEFLAGLLDRRCPKSGSSLSDAARLPEEVL